MDGEKPKQSPRPEQLWSNGIGHKQDFSWSHASYPAPPAPRSLARYLSGQANSSLSPPGGCFKDFTEVRLSAQTSGWRPIPRRPGDPEGGPLS